MNAVFVVLGASILYAIAYRLYGRIVLKKVLPPDERETPAHAMTDGVDYIPARRMILFGHHFSSIAGAGPIIGPLVAVGSWGWLPVLLWLVIGSTVIGGVHDYFALMVSVRNKGHSMADVAAKAISPTAKLVFSVFLWLTLVLVVSVFAVVTAKTLLSAPDIVIPSFGLIFLAVIFGYVINRLHWGLALSTVIFAILTGLLLYLGVLFPIHLPQTILGLSGFQFYFVVLLLYAFVASVLPVWILLQPRDYLSVWLLFAGLLLGFIGVIVAHPIIHAPAFSGFTGQQGPLWPILFIVVACGAISGFHSVVAGGTTAKQLNKEKDALTIGYGGMLMESLLAVIALMAVSAGLFWGGGGHPDQFHELMKSGWIVTFASGFGQITGKIPFLTTNTGKLFGMFMLNTFVLTTLDTATRLSRFVFVETAGRAWKPLGNRFVTTGIGLLFAFYMGISNSWQTIWPVFGAANQLVGGLALTVVTAYLIGIKRPSKVTLYPAIFMLLTTIGALFYEGYSFFLIKHKYFLGIIAVILVALAIMIVIEAFGKVRKLHLQAKTL